MLQLLLSIYCSCSLHGPRRHWTFKHDAWLHEEQAETVSKRLTTIYCKLTNHNDNEEGRTCGRHLEWPTGSLYHRLSTVGVRWLQRGRK